MWPENKRQIQGKILLCIRQNNWRRQWHPTPVLLPGKSHGWRSLVGCSLWGHEESDTTERLHFHLSFSYIGVGNGNPPQCSCLENPRDGEAWWAAVCGVTESWTWLKRLSSSRQNNSPPKMSYSQSLEPMICYITQQKRLSRCYEC